MNTKTTEPLITSAISRLSDMIGRATAWLSIVLMIVVSAIVLLRYGFDIGSVALQESAAYLHATFFMVGAAYTLKADDHVRVDIFYRNYSLIKKAWVNSIGSIVLLLPMCAFICLASIGLVSDSWLIKEGSGDTGGLSFVYLLKGLIPLMAILLALQAIADIFNNISLLSRHYGGPC